MASELMIVSEHTAAREYRREAIRKGDDLAVFTLDELASFLLREKGIPYRENRALEMLALWEAVWCCQDRLTHLGAMAAFTGFFFDVRRSIEQMDVGEPLKAMEAEKRQDLELVRQLYREKLARRQILDRAGKLAKALECLTDSDFVNGLRQVTCVSLDKASPLEQRLVAALKKGRVSRDVSFPVGSSSYTLLRADDPEHEVEYVAGQIYRLIEQGVPPAKIAVSWSRLLDYLPLICRFFPQYQLPWQFRGATLRDSPLGKSVLALLYGELEGWQKHHLLSLTAPGWGLPFALDSQQIRNLKLAPPVKGLAQWRSALGDQAGWSQVFDFIQEAGDALNPPTLPGLRMLLEKVISEFPFPSWPAVNPSQWAQLGQAWEVLQRFNQSLAEVDFQGEIDRYQLTAFLETALAEQTLRPAQSFHQEVKVLRLAECASLNLDYLFVLGLTEKAFAGEGNRHWLTGQPLGGEDKRQFFQAIAASKSVILLYPLNDMLGRENLQSPVVADEPQALQPVKIPPGDAGQAVDERSRGLIPEAADYLQQLFLGQSISATRLNFFARCPFQFFCAQVLNLEPDVEEEEELTALEEGRILHQIMHDFWRNHQTGPLPSLEEAVMEADSLLEAAFHELNMPVPQRIRNYLISFIQKDLERVGSDFRPLFLEKAFRDLTIQTSFGTVRIRGIIDRIDLDSQGNFVLYDYKTGTPPTTRQVLTGVNLQLPIYLLAAQQMVPGNCLGAAFYSFRDGRLCGLWRLSSYRRFLSRKNQGCIADEDWATKLAELEGIIRGYLEQILRGHFPPEPRDTAFCRYCSYQGICRREVR